VKKISILIHCAEEVAQQNAAGGRSLSEACPAALHGREVLQPHSRCV